jgi:hypothetical protein
MREGWSKRLSLALPLSFLDQEQARAPALQIARFLHDKPTSRKSISYAMQKSGA